jgi:AcrR family transcriptional regulator
MAERGRPRAFDRDEALRRAMNVFWARGYEGATVGDLATAMGINKPSLYGTFGGKEALFREAIALYDEVEGEAIQRALDEEPTARAAIEAVLRTNAKAYACPEKPHGCMIVLSALLGTPENEQVRRFLTETRKAGEEALRHRVARGMAEGDVRAGADAQAIAAFYTTVLQGLSVQACDGAAPAELKAIVDCAMVAWDTLAGEPAHGRAEAGRA